jgi:hypothetical protein
MAVTEKGKSKTIKRQKRPLLTMGRLLHALIVTVKAFLAPLFSRFTDPGIFDQIKPKLADQSFKVIEMGACWRMIIIFSDTRRKMHNNVLFTDRVTLLCLTYQVRQFSMKCSAAAAATRQ